ncbi:MAG: outer membrane beta-barrel protein [Hyphomicrobiales bacterium]|nr:outer membrane beta-barrel protein [Hyphomicrobiales bacterium]
MARSKTSLIAAGVALASGGLADAADLPPAPRLPAPEPVAEEFGGWYLCGDVGVGINATSVDLQDDPDPIATGISSGFLSSQANQAYNNTTLSPFGLIDVGAGYQFNSWLRADGTLEYRSGANLQSLYTLTDPASPGFGGPAQFADFYRADVSSFIGLVDGNVNLGSYWGMSPFVGAGVGFADNRVSGFTDQGIAASSFFESTAGGYFSNASKTSFAWALMAGLDFDINPDLRLEMGYRYLNYGSVETGGSHCLAGASGGAFSAQNCRGGVSNHLSSRNTLASNDFRIGLIWLMGAPPPPPAPIVARY